MGMSNIHVIYVTMKLLKKDVLMHTKSQDMRELIILVINVTTKLHSKAVSKHIKSQNMRVLNILVKNVTLKQVGQML